MEPSEFILVRRLLPENFNEKDLWLFRNALEKKILSPKVSIYKDVNIFGQSVLYKGRTIIKESFVEPSRGDRYKSFTLFKFLLKNKFFRNKIKIQRPAIWFTDEWSHEYFHWLADALPRLVLIKDSVLESVILLPEKYKKYDYINTCLNIFNVKEVIFIPEKAVAQVSHLTLPHHVAPTGNYNEDLLRKLNATFIEYSKKVHSSVEGERIYISRGKALRRKILNEDELSYLLNKYEFKTLYLEDLNFSEQVAIISRASCIISNHGAGLANMLFMKENSSVLELRREGDDHNNCYFTMASALNLKYYYQNCIAENNEKDTYTANLIVDTNFLEQNLLLMLNKR